MTFAQCVQRAGRAFANGNDEAAAEWIRRAGETKPEDPPAPQVTEPHPCVETRDELPPFRSPQSRIDQALVSIDIFLETLEETTSYSERREARRLREIRAELRGER